MTAANREFLDTNVLVYAVDDDEPGKRDIARELLADIGERSFVLSTQVLGEFYVVATRKLKSPISEVDAERAIELLTNLPVVMSDATLVRSAITLSRRHKLSFWDGSIIAAAIASGCKVVLTEDLSDSATIESITIQNPFA
jgi:predicted nucleic acid-binding protein